MYAVITCSSLNDYVDAAQAQCHTHYPVYTADRIHHVDPEEMKHVLADLIASIPPEYDTLLVAMGFCGGSWDQVTCSRTVVIPRVDDCVSLLLAVDDHYIPNRKEMGHMYLYEKDPSQFSATSLLRDYTAADDEFKGLSPEFLHHMWFDQYAYLDIIDTGINDCYSEAYVEKAQENADLMNASLDYVEGSIRLLKKLLTGQWDEQFLVAEPGHLIRHGDFF